ncbi:MAG: DNA polymerase III subunit delta [Pseudomonadota bacterium]
MRVYPEKLAAQLQQQLLPVYLVSGDEPLLQQECCDQVRRAARAAGCAERQLLDAGLKGFDWQSLLHLANSLSLFAERKLIELRIPNGKPGTDGSKALCEYLDIASGDDVLLIIAGKVDRQSTKSKWHKAVDAAGATLQVWPVDAKNLPRWLQQRVQAAGMKIEREALELLCDRVEGNLLAAVQEVEKLKLLAEGGTVTADTVTTSVSDNTRYNVYDLADRVLDGNARGGLRMLHGLRSEGTEPAVALWALSREIRTLFQARQQCDAGARPQQALAALGVWQKRLPLMQSALNRHSGESLTDLLERAATVDGSIKGFADGKPWDHLESLVVKLALAEAPQR